MNIILILVGLALAVSVIALVLSSCLGWAWEAFQDWRNLPAWGGKHLLRVRVSVNRGWRPPGGWGTLRHGRNLLHPGKFGFVAQIHWGPGAGYRGGATLWFAYNSGLKFWKHVHRGASSNPVEFGLCPFFGPEVPYGHEGSKDVLNRVLL